MLKRYRIIKDFLWQNKWQYAAGVAFLLMVDILQLIVPKILGAITDQLENGTLTPAGLVKYAALIVGISLLIAIGRFMWRVFVMGTARRLEYTLRNRLFRHLQGLSTRFFNTHKTGDLMAHATNDINAVRMSFGPAVVLITDSLFLSLMTLALMVNISWQLTLVSMIPLPFLAYVSARFGKMIHNRFRMVQEAFSELSDRAQENFAGIRVVKSFVQEETEIAKFDRANQNAVDKNMQLVRIWGFFGPLTMLISALSLILIITYGGTLVAIGSISLGDFVAFFSYLEMLTWPMMAIGWVINMLQRGTASMDRLNDILFTKPEIVDAPEPAPIGSLEGKIEFKNLTFSYGKELAPVLKNINLTVTPGQTLAIIGRTGSGKSTLVNLLLRLYSPPPNTVFIDDVDINRIPLATLRTRIGHVPQDNFLFSTTIAANVAFAKDTYDLSEVEEAARVAQVYDNIAEFPKGFETLVGERGVTLSGGQKQRVSIARAILKNPDILILDDCLSAVDTQTEERILERLRDIMNQRTSIIISHRISTIKDADLIIVMDNGEIVERGTHETLLAKQGLYYSIHKKQLLEEKLEARG